MEGNEDCMKKRTISPLPRGMGSMALTKDGTIEYKRVLKTYDSLNAFYRYVSVRDKFDNPMLLVEVWKKKNVNAEEKQIAYYDEEDIHKFVRTAGERYKTGKLRYETGYALAANLYMGLRVGELLALQWKDIDFAKRSVFAKMIKWASTTASMVSAPSSKPMNSVAASTPAASVSTPAAASGASVASAPADDPFAPANNGAPLVLDMSNIPNPDDFDEGAVW